MLFLTMQQIPTLHFSSVSVEMRYISFGHKRPSSYAKNSRNASVNVYSRFVVLVLMYFIPFSLFMKAVSIF